MEPDDLVVERLEGAPGEHQTRYRVIRPSGRDIWEVDIRRTTRISKGKLENGVIATIINPPRFRDRTGFIYTEEEALSAIKRGIVASETRNPE